MFRNVTEIGFRSTRESAPKARNVKAQGSALGDRINHFGSAEGAE